MLYIKGIWPIIVTAKAERYWGFLWLNNGEVFGSKVSLVGVRL